MSSRKTRNSLSTMFSHFIEVCGHPIHYFAHGVEIGVAAMILLSLLHPTHAFELSHAGLFLANMVLGSLLKKHHRSQKD